MTPYTKLHPQLIKDCFILGEFSLCTLLLMNDSHYPWFILVPKREGKTEIHQLSEADQKLLMQESAYFSRCLEDKFNPDKLNIAALGNVVPQLHIHHIARFTTDACWPAPVWGALAASLYEKNDIVDINKLLNDWFENDKSQLFHWNDETWQHYRPD